MLQIKVFNIRYRKKESIITITGGFFDSANSDWLYNREHNRESLGNVLTSENAPKEFEFILQECNSVDDVLLQKTDAWIKKQINKKTGLNAEAYNIRILG